jgi:hypothetical protein
LRASWAVGASWKLLGGLLGHPGALLAALAGLVLVLLGAVLRPLRVMVGAVGPILGHLGRA